LVDMAQVAWENSVSHVAKRNKGGRTRGKYARPEAVLFTTGPRVWTPIALHYQLVVLRGHVFSPCDYTRLGKCNITTFKTDSTVLGVHSFAHSWKTDFVGQEYQQQQQQKVEQDAAGAPKNKKEEA
jgi:hypothetical protein